MYRKYPNRRDEQPELAILLVNVVLFTTSAANAVWSDAKRGERGCHVLRDCSHDA